MVAKRKDPVPNQKKVKVVRTPAKPTKSGAVKTRAKPEQQQSKPTKPTVTKKPKTVKRKTAPKKPVFTAKDFEQFFYALELEDFIQYTKIWNQNSLKLKIPNHKDYDQWLNYFKTLSPNVNQQLINSGKDFLPTEAYSALSRWFDILSNPHRIDKIHQAAMTGTPTKGKASIVDLARKGDRMGVLHAVRDQLAEQMEKRATARDMASLAREMGDILDQIAALEKKAGPKAGTKAASLIHDFDARRARPGKNGGGARNTSFKSRVTIDDTEGKA